LLAGLKTLASFVKALFAGGSFRRGPDRLFLFFLFLFFLLLLVFVILVFVLIPSRDQTHDLVHVRDSFANKFAIITHGVEPPL
jgi:hypothetical protein